MQKKVSINWSENHGFTIIELMITVGIIAVIAAIAIPSYTTYVERSRCSQAQSDLLELSQWMERQYSTDFSYMNTSVDPAVAPDIPIDRSPEDTSKPAAFNYSLSSVDQTTFTLQAVPTNLVQSACETMTINEQGVQESIDDDGNVTSGW